MSSNASVVNQGGGNQSTSFGDGPQNNNTADGVQINYFGVNPKHMHDDKAEKLRKEKEKCLQSLSYSKMDARQHDIDTPYENTCDWLYETTEFRQWCDFTDSPTDNGILWIKGKPGAGKSTLMKHTLRHCQDLFKDHLIVSYFFNARGEMLEKTPRGMLQSITYHLLDKDPKMYHHFVPIFRDKCKMYGNEGWEWQQRQLEDFMVSNINKCESNLILFFDALDECNENDARGVIEFLRKLRTNSVQSGVNLRICLSSRHYPNIHMENTLELIVEKNKEHQSAIAKYTQENLRGEDDDIKVKIQTKADGIFMWVIIVVSLLNKAYDKGQIEAMKKTLEEVPNDLEEVFNTLLRKDDPRINETIAMLQWVLLSQRPLEPEELFAMVVGIAPPTSDTESTIQRRIIDTSKGLIEIRSKSTSVQFIHLSINDFLFRNNRLQTLDPSLIPEPICASHSRLWGQCRSYIGHLDSTLMTEKGIEQLCCDYPHLGYAANYLFDHAEEAIAGGAMRDAIVHWLQQDDWFEPWKMFLNMLGTSTKHSNLEYEVDVGLLYILSFHGYEHLVRVLLETKDVDVNAQAGIYGNALQAASFRGNKEVVGILLKNGAKANARGGVCGSALQAASTIDEEIVRMLLENGAKVNAQGGMYGNALQAAASEGMRDIETLLLKAGAVVNAEGGGHDNALQAAAARGESDIVRMLLSKGAKINARGIIHSNALHAAVAHRRAEIANMLLEAGAEVNAHSDRHMSVLQMAVITGEDVLVRMLLDNGANVNSQDGPYGNALQAAAVKGQEDIAFMLLERGANINAQGGPYGNALQAAIAEDEDGVMRVLLENGANIDTEGGIFGNTLQEAAAKGDSECVEELLKKGADVDALGGIYGTALQAAAHYGDGRSIKMLLERGADVNAQGGVFGNALQAASTGVNEEIIRILLDNNANTNAQGGVHGNALQAAIAKGQGEIVQILLENGADVNAQGGINGNALQAAIHYKRDEFVSRILERGANVNAQGGTYGNALQAAAANGRHIIVRMLLDNGADVNAKGGPFGNALQAAAHAKKKKIVSMLLKKGAKFQHHEMNSSLPFTHIWLAIFFLLVSCIIAYLFRYHSIYIL